MNRNGVVQYALISTKKMLNNEIPAHTHVPLNNGSVLNAVLLIIGIENSAHSPINAKEYVLSWERNRALMLFVKCLSLIIDIHVQCATLKIHLMKEAVGNVKLPIYSNVKSVKERSKMLERSNLHIARKERSSIVLVVPRAKKTVSFFNVKII